MAPECHQVSELIVGFFFVQSVNNNLHSRKGAKATVLNNSFKLEPECPYVLRAISSNTKSEPLRMCFYLLFFMGKLLFTKTLTGLIGTLLWW